MSEEDGELTGNIGIPVQIHLLGPGEIGYNLYG